MVLDNLDQGQIDDFIKVVDNFKEIIQDKKYKFIANHFTDGTTLISHPSKPNIECVINTINFEELLTYGLFIGGYIEDIHTANFIIRKEGIEFYEKLKREPINPIKRVEKHYIDFIKSEEINEKYPRAYLEWTKAEALLLGHNSQNNLTAIGHHCRDAVQFFSDELLNNLNIDNEYKVTETVAKIKKILNLKRNKLGRTTYSFLESLLNYWGCLMDLIQRQEHNGIIEREVLSFEDGRRVVFHTAILMYEFDAITIPIIKS